MTRLSLTNYFNKDSGLKQEITAAMPELMDKAFLEINSADGFFCHYAFSHMAHTVVGLSNNLEHIAKAQKSYPEHRFVLGSNLNGEMFDIILYHQHDSIVSESQLYEKIAQVMTHLKPSGKVLWKVSLDKKNSKNELTFQTLIDSFGQYTWRLMSNHFDGSYLFFLQRKQPFVIFSKKQAPELPYCYIKNFLHDIYVGRERVDEQLQSYVRANYNHKNITNIESKIFAESVWEKLLEAVVNKNKKYSFVLNMNIPEEYLLSVYRWFREKGFLMMRDNDDIFPQEANDKIENVLAV